ncbi:MAG: hypothetical protein AB7O73_07255 [Bacteroidia bacterium]
MGNHHDNHGHSNEKKPVSFQVPLIFGLVIMFLILSFVSLGDPAPGCHGAGHGCVTECKKACSEGDKKCKETCEKECKEACEKGKSECCEKGEKGKEEHHEAHEEAHH